MNARTATAHAPVVRLVKTAAPQSTIGEPVTELRIVVELRGATELSLAQLFRSLGDAAADREVRVEPEEPVLAPADGLVVDTVSRIVTVDGRAVHFTFMEFELLARLVAAPGRAFSRGQLLEELWNTTYGGGDRTIDVHVGRIRRKVGRFGYQLEAVPRVGYRWSAPARTPRNVEVPTQRSSAPVLVRASAV